MNRTSWFTTSRDWRRDVRTFVAGSACGFVAGGVFVLVALAQSNLLVPRWSNGARAIDGDSVNAAVVEPAAPSPAATGGRTAVGTSGAPDRNAARSSENPAAATELRDRRLLLPVDGVKPEALRRQFSDERSGHKHEAIDIIAARNTPVRAVEDGTIARLFFSKAGGITVYQFDPSGQFCYYYAHLERYADGLREGQSVSKGQLLGYVGTSGNAPKDTPHLHFAIFRLTEAKRWWEGSPIDPYDVLR
jgi:murein DD-endopeptidase MepM/ murein hydrolase activator NlpD